MQGLPPIDRAMLQAVPRQLVGLSWGKHGGGMNGFSRRSFAATNRRWQGEAMNMELDERLLQACLNGDRRRRDHPAVPETPAQLASAARSVVEAGADSLHVHPRDDEGRETLEASHVAACLNAIREGVPGVPVGVGTGEWIAPGGRARQELIRRWTVRPDYASVNLREADSPEVMALLTSMGVGIEAGVWSTEDARRFVTLDEARDCLRVLVELTSDDPAEAFAECRKIMKILDRDGPALPRLLHGENGSVWAMAAEAVRSGLSTRIGFEDVLTLPDGTAAPDNAALVREVCLLRSAARS